MHVDSLPAVIPVGSILDSLSPGYLYGALINGLRVYVLGDPRLAVEYEAKTKQKQPFLEWTGYRFTWDSSPGTISDRQVDNCREYRISDYLSSFSKSAYGLRNVASGPGFLTATKPVATGEECWLYLYWLLKTRYDCYPCFAMLFFTQSGFSRRGIHNPHGEVVFVPVSSSDSEKALRNFIESLYDVQLGDDKPVWLESISAPGQDSIDIEIEGITAELRSLGEALTKKRGERDEIRACLDVLYQSGPSLEIAVKSMLKELGAQVTESARKGSEDGWISVDLGGELGEGVLEIKSVRKANFDIGGLRQVNEWVQGALLETGKRYKGIFIGNHEIGKEPSQRADPFSSQWESRAGVLKVAAISTTTLLNAYRMVREGDLDKEVFWRRLFETDGVFRL
jgi:hypothetical protein